MRKMIFVILAMLVFAVPVLAQGETTVGEVDRIGQFLDFAVEADLLMFVLLLVAVVYLGRSVPQSQIDAGREKALATETPYDDLFWQFLDFMNAQNENPENPPSKSDEEPLPKSLPINGEGLATEGDSAEVPGELEAESSATQS